MGGRRARDDEVAAWRDDGWVVIEGLVDTDEVDEARADLHLLFARPERYHANPNASPLAITLLTSLEGRATILMPHPERVFRTVLHSWHPDHWGEDGPWMRMFRNARVWVG